MPADTVALIVEVAEASLDRDLGRKAEMYAAAGIPEYWVVDVNNRRVIEHRQPSAAGYAEQVIVKFGELSHSTAIDGLLVDSSSVPLFG